MPRDASSDPLHQSLNNAAPSTSAEQLLDIVEAERDICWATVIALTGMGSDFHLAQQRVHFLDSQPPPERTEP